MNKKGKASEMTHINANVKKDITAFLVENRGKQFSEIYGTEGGKPPPIKVLEEFANEYVSKTEIADTLRTLVGQEEFLKFSPANYKEDLMENNKVLPEDGSAWMIGAFPKAKHSIKSDKMKDKNGLTHILAPNQVKL